jgi:MarR family transcriptional regulator for hemolysin
MGVATVRQSADGSPEALAENLGWLLSQASHVLKTQMTAALEAIGISPRDYHVLATAMTAAYTQIELAQAVGLDKTTMVVTIDELETAGLAKRLPSTEDRRARLITVTKAGQRKVAEAEAIVDRVQAEVLGELPPRERRAFLEALAQLVAGGLAKPAPCAQPVRRR